MDVTKIKDVSLDSGAELSFLLLVQYANPLKRTEKLIKFWSDDLYRRSSFFSDLFLLDTKLKNKKLQQFFRLLPNQSMLPILKKLYSQK